MQTGDLLIADEDQPYPWFAVYESGPFVHAMSGERLHRVSFAGGEFHRGGAQAIEERRIRLLGDHRFFAKGSEVQRITVTMRPEGHRVVLAREVARCVGDDPQSCATRAAHIARLLQADFQANPENYGEETTDAGTDRAAA